MSHRAIEFNDHGAASRRGIVLASSGKAYAALAEHAARVMLEVMPDLPVDLYTDTPPDTPELFAQVHALEKSWFRPKFEALLRTRFDQALYCDTDIVTLTDISDIFDTLDEFDIVGAHSMRRASKGSREMVTKDLPMAFPMINTGVLAIRMTPQTRALLSNVVEMMETYKLTRDQGAFRQCLWESDLRPWVLPPEYNLMTYRHVDRWGPQETAPRVLHLQRLHHHIRHDRSKTQDLGKIVGAWRLARIEHMLRHDPSLAGRRKLDLTQWLTGIAALYPPLLDWHRRTTAKG